MTKEVQEVLKDKQVLNIFDILDVFFFVSIVVHKHLGLLKTVQSTINLLFLVSTVRGVSCPLLWLKYAKKTHYMEKMYTSYPMGKKKIQAGAIKLEFVDPKNVTLLWGEIPGPPDSPFEGEIFFAVMDNVAK